MKRDNATIVTSLVFLPMTAAAGLGGFLFMSGGAYSVGIADIAIPGASEHYHEGLQFFKKEKWRSARKKLELAITGSESISRGTKALFELGRVYEELGEKGLAERSYKAFVQRSAVCAEAEYMRAENYLREHKVALDQCAARDEIEVVWPD
ncbi:MAG: hypothetical protein IPK82_31755 [Polyangiaceae bacterium]|nr:hypothetical protein [Polyangiaceae bacterium]